MRLGVLSQKLLRVGGRKTLVQNRTTQHRILRKGSGRLWCQWVTIRGCGSAIWASSGHIYTDIGLFSQKQVFFHMVIWCMTIRGCGSVIWDLSVIYLHTSSFYKDTLLQPHIVDDDMGLQKCGKFEKRGKKHVETDSFLKVFLSSLMLVVTIMGCGCVSGGSLSHILHIWASFHTKQVSLYMRVSLFTYTGFFIRKYESVIYIQASFHSNRSRDTCLCLCSHIQVTL